MMHHADILASEAARFAEQIRSLSIAAAMILSGDAVADKSEALDVAGDLLDVIGFLSERAGGNAETLERHFREVDRNPIPA